MRMDWDAWRGGGDIRADLGTQAGQVLRLLQMMSVRH